MNYENDFGNQRSDSVYRSLIDFWDEGVLIVKFLTGNSGKVVDVLILDANEAIQRQTGLNHRDIIGKHATEVLPRISDVWFSRFNEIVSASAPIHFEEYSSAMNKWLEIKSVPLGPENIFGILLKNITLQKYNRQILNDDSKQFTAGKLNGIAHCRIIVDESGKPYDYEILKVNDNYSRIIGVKKEEIEGRRVRDVFPGIENFSFNYIGEYGKVALEGTELNEEAFFEITGQYLSLYAFSLAYGEFTVVFTDITAEKQMEISHKHQTELLQSILNSIPIMITIYDPDVTNINVNRHFEQITGWTQEEINRGDIIEMAYPDPAYREEVIDFMKNGNGWKDIMLTIKDGTKLISSWANINIPDGRQVGIGLDITERKRAEEIIRSNEAIMQAFFDSSPGILNLFDQDLKYLKSDHFTPGYFNLDNHSIIGKSLHDLNPEFAEKVLQVIMQKVIGSGEPLINIEVEAPIPSEANAIGNWLISYFPVPLPEGKDGLGVIGVDITSQKRAESALRESEERYRTLANNLQQANELIKKSLAEKDFFMKEIHHRVKNNLQIISSLLQLQMDRLEDQNMKIPFVEGANRIRAIAMIHEKLYSKNLERVISTDYIPELVNLIVNSYKNQEQVIDIDFNISRMSLEIDNAVYLGLLLNEILSNSYKHAFKNRASGKISIKLMQHSENEYELKISDNGIGLPSEVHKKGLGMLLIETLVEQIEGQLEIKNTSGTEYKIIFRNKLT